MQLSTLKPYSFAPLKWNGGVRNVEYLWAAEFNPLAGKLLSIINVASGFRHKTKSFYSVLYSMF